MTSVYKQHTVDDFMKYPPRILLMKRVGASMCIRAAREGLREGDERAPKALAHYLAERRAINEALHRHWHGDDGPLARTISLRCVSVAGDAAFRAGQEQRPGVVSLDEFLEPWKRVLH